MWISREISQASASTVRAHFGCIFKATADCATWAFGGRFICVYWTLDNGPGVTSVAKKKIRVKMRMAMAMAMRGFMRG